MPIRRSRMLRKDKFGGSRAGLPRPFQVFRQNPTWNEAIIYICRVKKKSIDITKKTKQMHALIHTVIQLNNHLHIIHNR